jgi:putative Ca2+/H+ antiporter (TMEM165/GDT1 family)
MFSLILLSELGDKSQVAILALAADSVLPIMVFVGAITAFVVMNAVGIIFGDRVVCRMPTELVRRATGIIFTGFGLLVLFHII